MFYVWIATTTRHPRGRGFVFSSAVSAAEARERIRVLYHVTEPLTALRPGSW